MKQPTPSTPFDRNGQPTAAKKGMGVKSVAALSVGSAVLGAYLFASWPETSDLEGTVLPTSQPAEFQRPGLDAFRIKPEDVIEPRIVTVTEQDDAEVARLTALIDDLNAKIAELAATPNTVVEVDQTGMQELRDRLAEINASLVDKDQALKELERDNLRLAAQIGEDDLARRAFEEEQTRKARLRAIAEARQQAADALHAAQVNSPVVGFRRGSTAVDAQLRGSGDDDFVRAGLDRVEVTRPQIIANPSYTVAQGTLIEATLQTGINSDLQGNIIAVISYDVWSFDLAQVVIPRGSRLFGRYSSDVGVGQKRVLVAWDRIITPDGQSVSISAFGTDRLGRSGLPGKVNNHFIERFGTAALISVIGATPEILAANNDDETTSDTLEAVGGDLSNATGSVIAEHINRPATITVEHGDIVTIIVNTDLEML